MTDTSPDMPTLSIATRDGGEVDRIRLKPASALHGAGEASFTAESLERTLSLVSRAGGGRAELKFSARSSGASVVIPNDVTSEFARNMVTLALSTGRAAATEVANSDNAAASLLIMFPVGFDSDVNLGPNFRRLASQTVGGGSRFVVAILRNTAHPFELDKAIEPWVEMLLQSDPTRKQLERHEASAVLHLSLRRLGHGAVVTVETLIQLRRIRADLNVDVV